ncbi:MAG: hypothetical protein ABEI77_10340 [Halorientalis sp.]
MTENLRTTEQFDTVGETITHEQVRENVFVSADASEHVAWLDENASAGVERVFLHDGNRQQDQYIQAFGDRVLPELRDA